MLPNLLIHRTVLLSYDLSSPVDILNCTVKQVLQRSNVNTDCVVTL